MKSGETGVVIIEHDVDMSNVSEVIVTLSSVAGEVVKRLSKNEIEAKPNNKILVPLSQDETVRLSRKTNTEVKVEGQIVFDDKTTCKTDIVTFTLGSTLNTEHVAGAVGKEGQLNAVSIRVHAGVIYAQIDPGDVEDMVEEKIQDALENHSITTGKSAYQVAVDNGFEGTQEQWLESLQGSDGSDGKSAYELAVENGFNGTAEEWLESLKGEDGVGGNVDLSDYAKLTDIPDTSEYVTESGLANTPINPQETKTGVYKGKFGTPTITQKSNNVVNVVNSAASFAGAFFEVAINPNVDNVITFDFANVDTEAEMIAGHVYLHTSQYVALAQRDVENSKIVYTLTKQKMTDNNLTTKVEIGVTSKEIATYDISVTNTYGDDTTIASIKDEVDEMKSGKSLSGKKILFLGDSITAFTGATSWVDKFISLTGATKVANVAVSGAKLKDGANTTYDGNPTSSSNNTLGNQVQKVINNQYTAPDLICIAIGTNDGISATEAAVKSTYIDANDAKVALADLDKTTSEGAFRYCNETLHNLYPDAIICWCNPIQGANKHPDTVHGWAEALRLLTSFGAVNNIETNRCGIFSANETAQTQGESLSDGLHPNANGALKIAKYNAAAISQLI